MQKHSDTERLNELIKLIENNGGAELLGGDFEEVVFITKGKDKTKYRKALDFSIENW